MLTEVANSVSRTTHVSLTSLCAMLAVMVNISIAGTYGDKPRFKLIYLVNNVIPNLPMMDFVRKLEKNNAHTGRCSSIQKHYQTVLSLKR